MTKSRMICLLTDEVIYAVNVARDGLEILDYASVDCDVPNSLLMDHDVEEFAEQAGWLAGRIAQAIEVIDEPLTSITLVIPMQWCFAQWLPATGRLGHGGRVSTDSLRFALEEYLPVGLDNVTPCFGMSTKAGVLGVAVPTEPMRALVQALDEHDIGVERIAVDVLTLLAATEDDEAMNSHDIDGVAIRDRRWIRAAIRDGDESQRKVLTLATATSADPQRSLAVTLTARGVQTTDRQDRVRWFDIGDPPPEADQPLDGLRPSSAVETLARAAATDEISIDLRCGELAAEHPTAGIRRLAMHCTICSIILIAIVTFGLYLRSSALEEQLTELDLAQRDVYTSVFHTDTIPMGAARRLASERIRLEGLTQTRSGNQMAQVKNSASALDLLREMVQALPADVRITLTDARIDGRQISLRGLTTDHRSAERIAESIGSITGISARPPRTDRLDSGGVSFTLSATIVTDKTARNAKG